MHKKVNYNWMQRDFVIINIANAHRVVMIWTDRETVILFDTLSGELTFDKPVLKKIILKCFTGTKNVIFLYGKIQGDDTLICGEHIIYFILFQNIYYMKNGYLDLNYISRLNRYCHKHNLTPDRFIWREIYIELNLAEPPDLMKVLKWFKDFKIKYRKIKK